MSKMTVMIRKKADRVHGEHIIIVYIFLLHLIYVFFHIHVKLKKSRDSTV